MYMHKLRFTIFLSLFLGSSQQALSMELFKGLFWGYDDPEYINNSLIEKSNKEEMAIEKIDYDALFNEEQAAILLNEKDSPLPVKPTERTKINFTIVVNPVDKVVQKKFGTDDFTFVNPTDALQKIDFFTDAKYETTLNLKIYLSKNPKEKKDKEWESFFSQIITLAHLDVWCEGYCDNHLLHFLKVRDLESLKFNYSPSDRSMTYLKPDRRMVYLLKPLIFRNVNLSSLDLSEAHLDIGTIFEELRPLPQLISLNLIENTSQKNGVEVFMEFIQNSQDLEEFSIGWEGFHSAKDYLTLSKTLKGIKTLRKLSIIAPPNSGDWFPFRGYPLELLELIKNCSGLQELHVKGAIPYNQSYHETFYKSLGEIISTHPTLRDFHFHAPTGSKESAIFFQSLIRDLSADSPLSHLHLKKWDIEDLGAMALSTILREDHKIRYISLPDGKISVLGAEALVFALKKSLKEGDQLTFEFGKHTNWDSLEHQRRQRTKCHDSKGISLQCLSNFFHLCHRNF